MPQPGLRVKARAPSSRGESRRPVLPAELGTLSVKHPLGPSVAVLGTPPPPFPSSLSWAVGGEGVGCICVCVCGIQATAQTSLCLPPPHALHHVAIRWAGW